jgi:flagellar hook-associated protein 3 FlgL
MPRDIGPLLPGRLPNSLQFTRLQNYVNDSRSELTRLQDQIATGRRLFLGSDDPAAASQSISLNTLIAARTQVQSNIRSSQGFLGAVDDSLSSATNVLNRAKEIALRGVGSTSTAAEKQALAAEADALLKQVGLLGNSTFKGRSQFGGSITNGQPFVFNPDNTVSYVGDARSIQSILGDGQLIANNVTGDVAFGGFTPPVSQGVNPAITLSTPLADLHRGAGLIPGTISVTVANGPPVTQTIDLSAAKTLDDVRLLIENAFPPAAVTVAIGPSNVGLTITPNAGTVSVSDLNGGNTAMRLGIAGGPSGSIVGGPLNPRITLSTTLSSLNAGSGIGPTAGFGLQIVNGQRTTTVDLVGAVTIEDLKNRVQAADPDATVVVNATGDGIAIVGRRSGVDFSVGENGGQNATLLGVRTLTAGMELSRLNYGAGVPVNGNDRLSITRRDGSTVDVNLAGAITVQDVLNAINAVDPGNLAAALNSVGNGITLTDNSGAGALTVSPNAVSDGLGLTGSAAGPATPLVGRNPNPQEVTGAFNVISRLADALRRGDNQTLNRLGALLDGEISRFSSVRGNVGNQLRTLEAAQRQLEDDELSMRQALSKVADTDLATAITQLMQRQTVYSAVLQSAARTLEMSLFRYI